MTILQAACLTIFPVLAIIAAASDMASLTIPNRIPIALALAYAPAALSVGLPLGEIGIGFGIGLAALVVAVGMFAAGWIGGGDAKLFAVASLWLGLPAAPAFLAFTALAGGVLALILMNARSPWVRALSGRSGRAGWRGWRRRTPAFPTGWRSP